MQICDKTKSGHDGDLPGHFWGVTGTSGRGADGPVLERRRRAQAWYKSSAVRAAQSALGEGLGLGFVLALHGGTPLLRLGETRSCAGEADARGALGIFQGSRRDGVLSGEPGTDRAELGGVDMDFPTHVCEDRFQLGQRCLLGARMQGEGELHRLGLRMSRRHAQGETEEAREECVHSLGEHEASPSA